jgi:hypothetical protein
MEEQNDGMDITLRLGDIRGNMIELYFPNAQILNEEIDDDGLIWTPIQFDSNCFPLMCDCDNDDSEVDYEVDYERDISEDDLTIQEALNALNAFRESR